MPSSHLIQHHILISHKWNFILSEKNDDTKVLLGNINNVHHFKYFNVRWRSTERNKLTQLLGHGAFSATTEL